MAACLLAFAACKQEKMFEYPGGFDGNLTEVASLSYDEATSGAKSAGFTWDAASALAAGATSFTLELTDDITTNDVENGTALKVVYAPETSYVMTSEVTPGKFYYARIRANYEGYWFSRWTYLGGNDKPLAVLVGTGVVEANFGAPAGLTAVPSETSFKASWESTPFADSYTFEYKAQSSGEWAVVSELKATTYEVEDLVGETTYDIRVKAHKGDTESDYTTGTVTTLAPSGFKPEMASADAFIEFLTTEAALASNTSEYSLEADIDLTGKTIPCADSFKGTLDGKGHKIKGLKSGSPLFATLSGTVKNLVIDASCSFVPTEAVFGIIAGESRGTISGVTNEAAVSYKTSEIAGPLLVAAIAGQSSGEISDCVNEGAISVASEGVLNGVCIAGIAGYSASAVKNCDNRGDITMTAKYVSAKVQVYDAKDALPSAGGVVAYCAPGFNMESCNNYGKITVSYSAIDTYLNDSTVNLNRNQHGGIVGSPCGPISYCKNYGAIEISAKHSTPGTAITNSGSNKREFILCVGGIGGGDYAFTSTAEGGTYSYTSYINCVNEGNIVVDSDAAQANSAIGGIVGWPGQEKPNTGTSVSGCTNRGNITGKGAMKCRIGGIEGGTGAIENSTNEGIITLEVTNTACAIGSVCGFHSQGHVLVGCTAKGEVHAKVKASSGVGGLIGNIGNAAHTTGTDCTVNCKITTVDSAAAETTGFVVGYFNGTSQAIVLGTPESPIKVSGSINGNSPSADNIRGSKNTNENHTINYNIL